MTIVTRLNLLTSADIGRYYAENKVYKYNFISEIYINAITMILMCVKLMAVTVDKEISYSVTTKTKQNRTM